MLWDIEYALFDRWERSPAFEDLDADTPEERTENERIREFLSCTFMDANMTTTEWSNTEKDRVILQAETWEIYYRRLRPGPFDLE